LLACACLRLVGLLVSYLRLVPWLMAIKNLRAGFPPTCELVLAACALGYGPTRVSPGDPTGQLRQAL